MKTLHFSRWWQKWRHLSICSHNCGKCGDRENLVGHHCAYYSSWYTYVLLCKIETGVEVFVIVAISSIFSGVKILMSKIVVAVVEAVVDVAVVEGGSRKMRRRTFRRSICWAATWWLISGHRFWQCIAIRLSWDELRMKYFFVIYICVKKLVRLWYTLVNFYFIKDYSFLKYITES